MLENFRANFLKPHPDTLSGVFQFLFSRLIFVLKASGGLLKVFISFKAEGFSYLNITTFGLEHVQNNTECGFACLRITSCFSYNLAASSDINGKLLCELLPSDKFNNSDKFTSSPFYHHGDVY